MEESARRATIEYEFVVTNELYEKRSENASLARNRISIIPTLYDQFDFCDFTDTFEVVRIV